MGPGIRIGEDDFKDFLLESDLLVDKSLLIKEFLEDSAKVVLVTRPRRWGKSLNMDMLGRFLALELLTLLDKRALTCLLTPSDHKFSS